MGRHSQKIYRFSVNEIKKYLMTQSEWIEKYLMTVVKADVAFNTNKVHFT